MTHPADSVVLMFEDGPAVWMENPCGVSPILITCDHASNRVPCALGTLQLAQDVLESHVAWDIGAIEVAQRLARLLNAPLISTNFSRLVYDVNRPPHSPQAIRANSEIYDIPGNRNLSAEARKARIEAIYCPFHQSIEELIEARASQGCASILVTVHSFTPVYHGEIRSVELGILHDDDARLADEMLKCAERFTTLKTCRNKPYGPVDGVTHTLAKHALPRGLLNVMIEIRNDLIRTAAGQAQLAETLANMLRCALQALNVPTENTTLSGVSHACSH